MGGLFSKNHFDVKGKTVLITGASEGMGKSVAIQLAQKGADIIIVARNIPKLEAALAEIQSAAADQTTQRFKYISADMAAEEGTVHVVAEATAWNNGTTPDIVWCIAGSSYPSLFLDTPPGKARQLMDVNYWSCWDMSQAIMREWLAPSPEPPSNSSESQPPSTKGVRRHLIFTSSVAAFYSVAGYASYSPSKAAIKSLSDTLAQEVLLYGEEVKIHTIFPGTIASPGNVTENLTKPDITHILEESDPVLTPDEVALKAIQGLEKGEYLVTVGFLGSAMRACAWGGSRRNGRVLDTLFTWIISIVWLFIGPQLDGQVTAFRRKHGHPSTYAKKV
ncbi:3-ketodihydrosphingosine reductase tsc-10 [Athelia psychrophila]|uniref:3-dehydrosphinganine reductase n=1 Tax=Athelia psychrophila TaxID=1759441 RepID=A0A167WEQ9_9AGAM|nr:3-ketodihydrosphingosine reductase tsc-10 [Fibularhizoctonia sp. CBS 109695]